MTTINREIEDIIELILSYKAFMNGKPVEVIIDGQKKIIEAKVPRKFTFTPPKTFEAANEAEMRLTKMEDFIEAHCELDLKGSVRGSILRDEFNRFSGLNLNNTRAFPDLMSRVMAIPIPYEDGSTHFITKTLDRGGSPLYHGLRLKAMTPLPPLPPFPIPAVPPGSPTLVPIPVPKKRRAAYPPPVLPMQRTPGGHLEAIPG